MKGVSVITFDNEKYVLPVFRVWQWCGNAPSSHHASKLRTFHEFRTKNIPAHVHRHHLTVLVVHVSRESDGFQGKRPRHLGHICAHVGAIKVQVLEAGGKFEQR